MDAPLDAPLIDSTAFSSQEYGAMLDEVRGYLPAFLMRSAVEQHDPAGDVRELLALAPEDLERVRAVHACLDDRVRAFIDSLEAGMRRPVTSTDRPREISQSVRGPIDWGATVRYRGLVGNDPSRFVVRPGRRIFDTPENRTLAWILDQLDLGARRALKTALDAQDDDDSAGWYGQLLRVRAAVRRARRVEWLHEVPAERPTPAVRQRLAAARITFFRTYVAGAAEALLVAQRNDEHSLTEMLCARFFRPKEVWRLFEVTVALRLAREFTKPEHSDGVRRARLLAGAGGVSAFARYRLHNGDEVSLLYQRWPSRKGRTIRQETAKRHGFTPASSIPDLFLVRTGKRPDRVILELKATKQPGYLGAGLSQLLGYLAERPEDFGPAPAAWLVAPPCEIFRAAEPVAGEPLWIVGADDVAQAAVRRFA
jgi:hypothetical protein